MTAPRVWTRIHPPRNVLLRAKNHGRTPVTKQIQPECPRAIRPSMAKSKHTLKEAKKAKARSADAVASQEQRVGKVPQRSRTSGPIARPKPKLRQLNETEKRVRALNKKLRDIEALRQREADGETLDEQQLAKLESLGDVLAQLEELIPGS